MKCPKCKKNMRMFGSFLGLGNEFLCINTNCLFYGIKRYYSKRDCRKGGTFSIK
jgi:hypothetical protein